MTSADCHTFLILPQLECHMPATNSLVVIHACAHVPGAKRPSSSQPTGYRNQGLVLWQLELMIV